jgi:hypothetical protein
MASLATMAALDYYSEAAGTEFTLSFGDGERVKEFYIDVIDDNIPEADEQILFVITDVSGEAAIGTQRETTVNIIDDEPFEKPEIGFSADSYSTGGNSAEITLVRTAGIHYYAGGKIYTIDGSALGNEDYTGLNQSFLFMPGQTEMKLSVPVVSNSTQADKYFYVKVVPDESCTLTGSDRVQVWLRKSVQATALSPAGFMALSTLSDEEGVTLGEAQTVYDYDDFVNFTRSGSSKAYFYVDSERRSYEVNIQHDSISAKLILNRTLYKSMLESIKTNMTLHQIECDNHFDIWIDATFTSTLNKTISLFGKDHAIPTFFACNNLLYGRDGHDVNHPNLTAMDRSTSDIKDDPFNLAFTITNGNGDYGVMRLFSVTLNYRHFKIVPVPLHDTMYTFDFSKDTDEYTAEDVIPGTVDITDGSGQKIDGFYTSQNYTLHVSPKDVLPGYYLRELRFYDSVDAGVAKSIAYPMEKTGGTLTVDNDFLVKYGGYSVSGDSGSRNFLIQPVFVRDPATLTISINDSDKNKGEVLGVNFGASAQTKTYTKNNTNKINLHEGDKVVLTGVGTGENAVTGFYVTTGDGTASGKKTEAAGEHLAGVLTLSLAKTNEVTPIFGARTLTIKPDPAADPGLTGTFNINGAVELQTKAS